MATIKTRTIYHVVPSGSEWAVEQEGGGIRATYRTKQEAVDAAKQRVQGDELSQIKVHTSDGKIEYEHTYGEDPTRSIG